MIVVSLLSSDLSNLAQEAEKMFLAGADRFHMDIMDGHFVSDVTFGPCVIKSLRLHLTTAYIDCHLMVSDPVKWIEMFADAGASQITFHIESISGISENHKNLTEKTYFLIDKIRKFNMKVGIAVNPTIPIKTIFDILKNRSKEIYMVLIITAKLEVEKLSFIPEMIKKIEELNEWLLFINADIIIGVYGGINNKTTKLCSRSGAKIFIIDNHIVNSENRKKQILELRKSILFCE